MARRIARIIPAHLRAIVATGRFSDPATEGEVLRVLVGRRERILRWSFARVSPLTDVTVEGARAMCARDLAVATGVSGPARTLYRATLQRGADLTAPRAALAASARGDGVCVTLPLPALSAGLAEDDAARYAVLEIARQEGARTTRLRAHLYEVGGQHGWVIAGLERE